MQVLHSGSKGPAVEQLQRALSHNGYAVTADGCFGRQTEQAVRQFQFHAGLTVDGIVGHETLSALEADQGTEKTTQEAASRSAAEGERQGASSMQLSPDGLDFLYRHEALKGVSNRLHWPGGGSGVTLGPGYDMRERTAAEITKTLLALGLNEEQAARVAQAAGKRGEEARVFASAYRTAVTLTYEQERNLLNLVVPPYVSRVQRAVTVPLTQHEFDALVSFAYNPGGLFSAVCRNINQASVSEAMRLISSAVYSRTKSGKVKLPGLVRRRQDEVELYLRGNYL